jgi:hypothetical protein
VNGELNFDFNPHLKHVNCGGLNCGREVRTLDVDKMLIELRLEREQIEEAILTLERLARGRGRRRGRPPGWLKEATAAAAAEDGQSAIVQLPSEPRRRGRPPGSKSKANSQSAEA